MVSETLNFCDITKRFGSCAIDLFASRVEAKLDRYVLGDLTQKQGRSMRSALIGRIYILLLPTLQPDSPGSTEAGVFGGRLCDGRTTVDDVGLVQQNDETSRRYATPASPKQPISSSTLSPTNGILWGENFN